MIVHNSHSRVIVVHYVPRDQKQAPSVQPGEAPSSAAIQTMVKTSPFFDFLPGNNEISQELWKLMLEDAEVKRMNDLDILQVVMDSTKNGLADIKVQAAIEIVKETFDEKLLKQWLKIEKRSVVCEEIEKQIESLAIKKDEKSKE